VRTSVAFAVLLTKFSQIIVLFLENELCGVPCSLIGQVLVAVQITRSTSSHEACTSEVLVAALLWQDVVVILYYEINILRKVFTEFVKLW
jgi:hypothetical protein